MKSSTQHSFAVLPKVEIPRSSFRRNCTYKTTFNAGDLNCIFLDEVLPGDTFNLSITSFMRILSPLKYPIMDNLYCDFQFFFVPIRLVYDDYEKFFGSSTGPDGNWTYDDSHLMPSITSPANGWAAGSLADQFGLPINVGGLKVNALPFRCYNRIIADWYRPSSYQLALPECKTDSSDDDNSLYSLRKRLKRPEYFTGALIAPQRGPGVDLPLGQYAPTVCRPDSVTVDTPHVPLTWSDGTGAIVKPAAQSFLAVNNDSGTRMTPSQSISLTSGGLHPRNLWTDLRSATAVSINTMRQAFQLQRALERDMRGGVRYVSQLMSHFGVRSPDARLQRSEYLGGGSVPIQIHTVANTSGSDGKDQASLAAYGVSGQNHIGFVKSFTEHGYILGLASVRADVTYQQGIPRMFDRFARFDFYYPVFSHLGEQVVKNKEIYADGSDNDEKPFGYQERFAEYRYSVNKITGELRSTYSQPLDAWHLAQKFNNCPRLNLEFLAENVPMSRVKAVTTAPDFLYDSLINLNCVRPMPLFGVPGLADHF